MHLLFVGFIILVLAIIIPFSIFATGYRVLTHTYVHELEKLWFYFCLFIVGIIILIVGWSKL